MREEFSHKLSLIQLRILFKDLFHEFVIEIVRVDGGALQWVALESFWGRHGGPYCLLLLVIHHNFSFFFKMLLAVPSGALPLAAGILILYIDIRRADNRCSPRGLRLTTTHMRAT